MLEVLSGAELTGAPARSMSRRMRSATYDEKLSLNPLAFIRSSAIFHTTSARETVVRLSDLPFIHPQAYRITLIMQAKSFRKIFTKCVDMV